MNKKVVLIIVILLVGAVIAWFFVNKSKNLNASVLCIPANSSVVFTMDLKSVLEKSKIAEFKDSKLLTMLYDEMDESEANTIKDMINGISGDPMSSGVNFLTPVMGFVEMDKKKVNMGMVIGISDAGKFGETLKKGNPEVKIQDGADYQFIHFDGDKFAMAWNDQNAIVYQHKNSGDIMARIDSMLNHKIDHVGNNAGFKKFKNSGSDIAYFINYGALMEASGTMAVSGFKMPSDYYYFGDLNFNDGKIAMTSETYFVNKEDEEMMSFMGDGNAADVLPVISAQKPLVFFNLKLNFAKFYEYLIQSPELAKNMTEIESALDLKPEEMKQLLNGEIALAFGGMESRVPASENTLGNTATGETAYPQLNLYLGIGNKEALNKILAQTGLMKNANGFYDVPLPGMSFSIVETENALVFCMDQSNAIKIAKEGKLSNGDFGDVSKFSTQYSSVFYADLNTANFSEGTKGVLQKQLDEDGYALFEMALAPFNEMKAWNTSAREAKCEVTMKDASSNSLYQILKMIETVGVKGIEMQNARHEQMEQMFEEDLRDEDVMIVEPS